MIESIELRLPEEEAAASPTLPKPEDCVKVWSKAMGNIIVSVERVKATPALYLFVYYGGEEVYEYGPFFSKKSFNPKESVWEEIAVELEKRGGKPLQSFKPQDWNALLEEVRRIIPPSPIMPPVSELGSPIPVTVEDLARHGDLFRHQPVEFEGVIVGRSEIKTVPVAAKVVRKEGKKRIELVVPFDLRKPDVAIGLVTHRGVKLDEARFFILLVQQHMGHDKFTVYIVGCDVPRSKMVRIRGVVVSEGKRSPYRLVVLATEVEPLNEVAERLQITPELLKEGGLRAASYEELKGKVDSLFAPKIRGRPFAKLAYALTLFSVETLHRGGGSEDGIIWTLFYGDTKTGKSSIAKWVYEKTGLGAYTVAETGSRAGLLYTVDTETRTVIWGAVTLADGEYAVVDGFDKMNPEEWKEFRESKSNQRVVVMKKAQATAPFRVRLILCANTENPLSTYVYPIEGLRDIRTLAGKDAGASITRIDLFIPFSVEDVPAEEVVEAALREPSVDTVSLKRKILITWKARRAVFEGAALERLERTALNIVKAYASMKPPIVHLGFTSVVLKVAAAFASLLGKYRLTESGLEVVVTEDVAPFVERFFEEYTAALGLPVFVKETQADIEELVEEVLGEPVLAKALMIIFSRQQQNVTISKSELGATLGIRDHNKQQQLVNRLVEKKLITAKQRVGLLLTAEGRRVVKELLARERGTQNAPLGVKKSGLPEKVCCETDYLEVGQSNQAETTRASVSESEHLYSLAEPSSEFEPQQPPSCGLINEQLNNLFHSRLLTPDQIIEPPNPLIEERGGSSQKGESEEGVREDPYGFAACYLRLAQRLREEANGLSEEEVIRYAVEQGFSEKLVRVVLQFMRERGKVSELRQGWLVWSG